MRVQYILLAIVGAASAKPKPAVPKVGAWHPDFPNSVRGPCPALNSLANHGFIPRDGKNLSVPVLVKAIKENLNVSDEVATIVAKGGLRTSSDPTSGTYSLDDLNKHNIVEHDASLSRKDVSVDGDNFSFDAEVFAEFLSYFNGSDTISVPAAAAARWGRVNTEKARDPKFTYSENNQFNSYVETAFYLELFRDPATKLSSTEFVKIFFEKERLPLEEGWRPTNQINGLSLLNDVLALALNTPEKAPGIGGAQSFHSGAMF